MDLIALALLTACEIKPQAYQGAHIEADSSSCREIVVQDLQREVNSITKAEAPEFKWLNKWQTRLLKTRKNKPSLDSDGEPFKYTGNLPEYFLDKINRLAPSLFRRQSVAEDRERLYFALNRTIYIFEKENNNELRLEKEIKVSLRYEANIITNLRLDRKGRLIVFIKNSTQALSLSQDSIH